MASRQALYQSPVYSLPCRYFKRINAVAIRVITRNDRNRTTGKFGRSLLEPHTLRYDFNDGQCRVLATGLGPAEYVAENVVSEWLDSLMLASRNACLRTRKTVGRMRGDEQFKQIEVQQTSLCEQC